jgi:hypothetical protein
MFFTERNKELVRNVKRLQELEKRIIELNKENEEHLIVINQRENSLNKLIKEKSKGFPWLAKAISEFYSYPDLEIGKYLEQKKHPAYKSAEAVREVSKEKKELRKKLKIAKNFVTYYETLFPWINDYVGEDLDELLEDITDNKGQDEKSDPVLKYIQKAEYKILTPKERNQKALDRYLASRKSPWKIGRDYERYIGYLYEKKGYHVEYVGIEKGLEDLGRDLICTKEDIIEVIQCKCWAKHKVIREKHINQLYGTAVKHHIENEEFYNEKASLTLFPDLISSGKINATFVTSTNLSETATKFAQALGVKIIENKLLEKYPVIKCNVNTNGEKIYHLPFDQQYDRTLIKNSGEFYALTVDEAEKKGFRRAFRWMGKSE